MEEKRTDRRKFRSVKRKKRKGFCGKTKQEKERLAEDGERDHIECDTRSLVSADREIQSAEMTTRSEKSDDMNEAISNFCTGYNRWKEHVSFKACILSFRMNLFNQKKLILDPKEQKLWKQVKQRVKQSEEM